jgi:ribosomal protein L9
MSWKIDVVLLQAVKSLWQKNQVVSVSVAYAKNVLFPKSLAKQADANVKNDLAQKKEQDKKHLIRVQEIRDNIMLYVQANEPMIIKRKVTPSWSLYEKVHENDVKVAFSQRQITLPSDIIVKKNVWEQPWLSHAEIQWGSKKLKLQFTIKESFV